MLLTPIQLDTFGRLALDCQEQMTYLIEYLPPHVHIAISTRAHPYLPFARLGMQGQILELRMDALRSTCEEVTYFLNDVMHLSLTETEITHLINLEQVDHEMLLALQQRASHWYEQNGFLADDNNILESEARDIFPLSPPQEQKTHANSQQLVDSLSMREIEVLQLMARGDSNREIANKLVITSATVKRHVSNILSKLQAINRTQAVAYGRDLGLLS